MADAAFYYLNSSVHASSPASTSIFGLSTWKNYHYYYGHVMWDIETFNVPVVTLLQPFAARALLDFRHSHLAGARNNAQVFGRLGLQFPWESSISGEETAPLPGSASWHEDHASLDVALAFSFYAEVTGDDDFFKNKAWPGFRVSPNGRLPLRQNRPWLRDMRVHGQRRKRGGIVQRRLHGDGGALLSRENDQSCAQAQSPGAQA